MWCTGGEIKSVGFSLKEGSCSEKARKKTDHITRINSLYAEQVYSGLESTEILMGETL